MTEIDLILKDVKKHTPKNGFAVCGVDDFELIGEQLYIIKKFDILSDAEQFAKSLKVKYLILGDNVNNKS
jgi:hypothetical protein